MWKWGNMLYWWIALVCDGRRYVCDDRRYVCDSLAVFYLKNLSPPGKTAKKGYKWVCGKILGRSFIWVNEICKF